MRFTHKHDNAVQFLQCIFFSDDSGREGNFFSGVLTIILGNVYKNGNTKTATETATAAATVATATATTTTATSLIECTYKSATAFRYSRFNYMVLKNAYGKHFAFYFFEIFLNPLHSQ